MKIVFLSSYMNHNQMGDTCNTLFHLYLLITLRGLTQVR